MGRSGHASAPPAQGPEVRGRHSAERNGQSEQAGAGALLQIKPWDTEQADAAHFGAEVISNANVPNNNFEVLGVRVMSDAVLELSPSGDRFPSLALLVGASCAVRFVGVLHGVLPVQLALHEELQLLLALLP